MTTNPIRGISLDVWGTLVTSDRQQRHYRSELLAPVLGWRGDDLAEVTKAFSRASKELDAATDTSGVQYSTRERLDHVCNTLGVPALNDEQYIQALALMMDSQMRYMPTLIEDGLLDTLESWRRRGLRLAIICNTGAATGEIMAETLRRRGVLAMVEFPLWSDQEGVAKPDRRIYDRLVEVSGIPAGRWLHLGDNRLTDYNGAAGAGFHALQYTPAETVSTGTTYLRHRLLDQHPLFRRITTECVSVPQ